MIFQRLSRFSPCVLSALLLAVPSTWATVITIGASMDNTIFQSNLNNSLGGGQSVFAGTNSAPSPRRGLMAFDIASAVPAGSTINSVQLTLYLNQVGGAGGGSPTVRLYRISGDWGEGTAGNTVTGASGTGQGFAVGTGDATWNARHFSATTPTLWSTAGGDFAASDSAASTIVGTILNVPYTWGSTSGMVSDVQNWLNTPAMNFGWMLKNDDESSSQTVRGFWTREAADPTRNPQPTLVPQLQITYTVPEPMSGLLLLTCAFVAVSRRTR